jgi:two-component system, LuxR family, response regulator FixJ
VTSAGLGSIDRKESYWMEGMNAAQVVFVDDEPAVCSVVHKTLERAGASVACFQNAQDCLRHLAARPCDLLITDVKMPGMDGMDLLQCVKERLPWLPVLVVTGYGDVPMAVRALKAGAADFVEKPLDRDSFLQAVQRLVRHNVPSAAVLEGSLTKTEKKVLYHLLDGRNNREIADALHRSPRTIEIHRSHVMQKLGAGNIIELLRQAANMGLLPSPRARRERPEIPGDRPPQPKETEDDES